MLHKLFGDNGDVRAFGRIFWLAAPLVAAHEDAALMLDKPVLFCVGAPTRAGAAPRERVAKLASARPCWALFQGFTALRARSCAADSRAGTASRGGLAVRADTGLHTASRHALLHQPTGAPPRQHPQRARARAL